MGWIDVMSWDGYRVLCCGFCVGRCFGVSGLGSRGVVRGWGMVMGCWWR